MKQRLNKSFERSKMLEELLEKHENIKEKRELDVMNQVFGKHHQKQISQKKKEREDLQYAMLAKQKKLDAEKIIQDRLDFERQNEKEKHQGLQKKFN